MKTNRMFNMKEWAFMMTEGKSVTRYKGDVMVTHMCSRCSK